MIVPLILERIDEFAQKKVRGAHYYVQVVRNVYNYKEMKAPLFNSCVLSLLVFGVFHLFH